MGGVFGRSRKQAKPEPPRPASNSRAGRGTAGETAPASRETLKERPKRASKGKGTPKASDSASIILQYAPEVTRKAGGARGRRRRGWFFREVGGNENGKAVLLIPPSSCSGRSFWNGGGKNEEGIESMVAKGAGSNCYFASTE